MWGQGRAAKLVSVARVLGGCARRIWHSGALPRRSAAAAAAVTCVQRGARAAPEQSGAAPAFSVAAARGGSGLRRMQGVPPGATDAERAAGVQAAGPQSKARPPATPKAPTTSPGRRCPVRLACERARPAGKRPASPPPSAVPCRCICVCLVACAALQAATVASAFGCDACHARPRCCAPHVPAGARSAVRRCRIQVTVHTVWCCARSDPQARPRLATLSAA